MLVKKRRVGDLRVMCLEANPLYLSANSRTIVPLFREVVR